MSKKKKKSKAEKVVYYDDNSTIADMKPVDEARKRGYGNSKTPKRQSTFKEKWKTYWSTVKMMLLPMCIVLCIIGIIFLIWLLAT